MALESFARQSLAQFAIIYAEIFEINQGKAIAPDQLETLMWGRMCAKEAGITKTGLKIPFENIKRAKVILPYMPNDITYTGCCAIKKNGGLYTPCCGKVAEDTSYCKTCSVDKEGEAKELEFGSIEDRESNVEDERFAPITFGEWMKGRNTTLTEVYSKLAAAGIALEIPSEQLVCRTLPKTRRGRPSKSDEEVSDEDSAPKAPKKKPVPKAKASPKASPAASEDEAPKKKKAPKAKEPEPESESEVEEPKKVPKPSPKVSPKTSPKASPAASEDEAPKKKVTKPKAESDSESEVEKPKKVPKPSPKASPKTSPAVSEDEAPKKKAKEPKAEKPEKKAKEPKAEKAEKAKEPKAEKPEKKAKEPKAEKTEKPKEKKEKAEKPKKAKAPEPEPEPELDVDALAAAFEQEEPEEDEMDTCEVDGKEYNLRNSKYICDMEDGTILGTVDDEGDVVFNSERR
jgi:hypothetical protein